MKILLYLLFLILPFSVNGSTLPQQIVTPDQIISEVNALRASQGLAPYTVDPWLMAYAQGHAEYMAATGQNSHVHSDGSLPWESGIQENVAGGSTGYIDVYTIVHEIWADPVHGKVMTGYASGDIGAGVASDGELDYISLNVRPGKGNPAAATTEAPSMNGDSEVNQATSEPRPTFPFVPIVTATPMPDGSVYHTVGEGETLWSIAKSYGITLDRLLLLNGFADESVTIYVGQRLLIQIPPPAITVTISDLPSVTATIDPVELTPSATPSPTLLVMPTQPREPTPSPTETDVEIKLRNERLARTLILAAAILSGFILLYYLAFRGPRRY